MRVFHKRLHLVYLFLCVGLGLICARLFFLQVLQVTDIDVDYILLRRPSWQEMPASRGKILDRKGIVLAEDRPILNLAVQYKNLDLPRDSVPSLVGLNLSAEEQIGVSSWLDEACRITGRDREEDREEVLQTRDNIVRRVRSARRAVDRWRAQRRMRAITKILEETIPHTLIKDIPLELAARIEADPGRFPGVVVRVESERRYLFGRLAAHAMGYVTKARRPAEIGQPIRNDPTILPGDRIGELGAERQFDKWLRGSPGYYELQTNRKTGAVQRKVLFSGKRGRDIHLTIDAGAQMLTEEALAGRAGGAIAMDVHTGEVLVLASSPVYDNNDLNAAFRYAAENPSSGIFLSRALRGPTPSGSVIKPIVALAGAAEGAVRPETRFTCAGAQQFGRARKHCSGHHGSMNMTEAIEHSCNIWFYNAGLKAGPQAIRAMAWQLNWGHKTGIDLPGEAAGRLPRPGPGWYAGHTLNLSIGQGNLLVTPLQVAVAMAAIANGGAVLQPHILARIEPPPDDNPLLESYIKRRIDLPPQALEAIRTGMQRVPGPRGTARRINKLRTLKAAAKTGTAQIGRTELNHAWIAGYAPYDNPKYAFAVVIHHTSGHGADEAGPVAAEMLEALLGK